MQSKPEIELLLLNTAVIDIRSEEFDFVQPLVGPGGLAKCPTASMPRYTEDRYREWLAAGCVTAGGPGNTAPLAARAGIRTAVGAYVGQGREDGFDVAGKWFRGALQESGVDVSAILPHPGLPTGTTFIQEAPGDERGGIAYFPNANNAFDFKVFSTHVARLTPRITYYMYSGLSDAGDAHGGRDLAEFMANCRRQGSLTIADSHTLCSNPDELIRAGSAVEGYRLLDPLLPELDLFFTSWDEARMIRATLESPLPEDRDRAIPEFLHWLIRRYGADGRPRIFGVTLKDGAYTAGIGSRGEIVPPRKIVSRFRSRGIVDLVGAGDSFRAGVVSYVARHADAFRQGNLDLTEAVQTGNLMATLYVTSPLNDRYGAIPPFDRMLALVRNGREYETIDSLKAALAKQSFTVFK